MTASKFLLDQGRGQSDRGNAGVPWRKHLRHWGRPVPGSLPLCRPRIRPTYPCRRSRTGRTASQSLTGCRTAGRPPQPPTDAEVFALIRLTMLRCGVESGVHCRHILIAVRLDVGWVVAMARARSAAHWRPVGGAATFVLAAVAGVVGNQLTGHLTPALVIFVVLLTAGMVIVFSLERCSGGQTSDEDPGIYIAGGPSATYDMRAAQGVQIGDDNWQTNYFGAESEPDGHE